MGCIDTIAYEKFPKQRDENYKHSYFKVGSKVKVSYHYDTSKYHYGTIVRYDLEEPFETIIKLDNGRYLRAVECQFSYIDEEVSDDVCEPSADKIKVTSLEVIVNGSKRKPYYEIKYKEVGTDNYNIGYSSYNLDFVFDWKEKCFELVKVAEELKATKSSDIPIIHGKAELELHDNAIRNKAIDDLMEKVSECFIYDEDWDYLLQESEKLKDGVKNEQILL